MACLAHVRRPDGVEFKIDLVELEDALGGVRQAGQYYLLADSGSVVFLPDDEDLLEEDDDDTQGAIENSEEPLPIDPLDSRTHFAWMEEFIDSVHSITAQNALRDALRHKRPFRNFKDALLEFPQVREKWFQFEGEALNREALGLIESFDWEILKVVDTRPSKVVTEDIDPAELVPLTSEEHEWILRGAWQIAAMGGRSQLALLLKGSKSQSVLKHGLAESPAYGKLSYLTIEEIENRIDQLIRKGELRTEFFGDLPLIVLTDQSWADVRPWAHRFECEQAAVADSRTLTEILTRWRNRRRDEQFELVAALAALPAEAASRVLEAWRSVSGKEVRSRIENTISRLTQSRV